LNKDQILGGALLIIGIAGIIIYGWLVFFSAWQMFVIQLTAFIAIAAVLAIIAWIGYTLATTPPPKPIEEIEKEIEKELSEIKKEEEVKKEETKTN